MISSRDFLLKWFAVSRSLIRIGLICSVSESDQNFFYLILLPYSTFRSTHNPSDSSSNLLVYTFPPKFSPELMRNGWLWFFFQVSDIYSFPQEFSPLFCSSECRGQQTVSAKGQIVNTLSFASHGVPALNTASVAPKQPHTYVNKCTYLCSMIIVGAGLDWAFGPFLLFISYLSPTPYSL